MPKTSQTEVRKTQISKSVISREHSIVKRVWDLALDFWIMSKCCHFKWSPFSNVLWNLKEMIESLQPLLPAH